jgi:hypothetical protein
MAEVKVTGSSISLPIGREERLAELIWRSILDADKATAAVNGRQARRRQRWENLSPAARDYLEQVARALVARAMGISGIR